MSSLTRARPLRLTDGDRAELYLALGRGLHAGLPPDRVLEGASDVCDGALNPALRRAAGAVRKGTGLMLALDRQGLVSEIDYAMLSCAEDAGAIDQVLLSLADRYETRNNRFRKIKGKLFYPAAILVLAIFIAPVPALFAGRISAGDYALRTLGTVAMLVVAVHVLQMLIRLFNARGWPGTLSRVARLLPVAGELARLHERAEVTGNLALMHKAGMPVRDALDAYRQAEPQGLRREKIVRAKSILEGGSSVADALDEAELIDSREGYAVISTGEGAGKLDESLLRYSAACLTRLDDKYDVIGKAVPLVVFLIVAWLVVGGMF
ncbi:MAG: type II secretion system F family protein [Gammaproteobacteria bacterium]|nr:type II secretion system F family protein [Gammaproteobacteria bacterium]